jgi:hypothetical protein
MGKLMSQIYLAQWTPFIFFPSLSKMSVSKHDALLTTTHGNI